MKESSEVIGPQPPLDFGELPKGENGMPVLPDEIRELLEHFDQINCAACEGLVDWGKLADAADENGCEAYIVEREYSAGDRISALQDDITKYRQVL